MSPATPSAAPPATSPGTVLVSGGSGYIAGFLIRRLLDLGWTVHTTVRNLAREAELRRRLLVVMDERQPGGAARLKFFAADLTADAGWAEATAGCSHVAHLASPVPAGVPKQADELVVPARDGVLRALRAARDAGSVRRFVMTSSVAAIAYGRGPGVHHYTEADWTPLDHPARITPYVQSKTVAERAARDWVAAQEGGSGGGSGAALEFCSINPSVVLGPVWGADHSASVLIVRKLLDGSLRACPDIGFGVVDVRDLAELHVRALVTPGLGGERFIANGRFLTLIELAGVLRAGLGPELARRVPSRRLPDWLVRLAGLFHPLPRSLASELGSVRHQSAEHAHALLGWSTRPVEHSILDCARSLIAQGLVDGLVDGPLPAATSLNRAAPPDSS